MRDLPDEFAAAEAALALWQQHSLGTVLSWDEAIKAQQACAATGLAQVRLCTPAVSSCCGSCLTPMGCRSSWSLSRRA